MKKLSKILARTSEVLSKAVGVIFVIAITPIALIVYISHGASLKDSFNNIGYALEMARSNGEES